MSLRGCHIRGWLSRAHLWVLSHERTVQLCPPNETDFTDTVQFGVDTGWGVIGS